MSTTTKRQELVDAARAGSERTVKAVRSIVADVDGPTTAQGVFEQLAWMHGALSNALSELIDKLPPLTGDRTKPTDGYYLSAIIPPLSTSDPYPIHCGECEEPTDECTCGGEWDEDLEEYDGEPHECGVDCDVYADDQNERLHEMFAHGIDSGAKPYVNVGRPYRIQIA